MDDMKLSPEQQAMEDRLNDEAVEAMSKTVPALTGFELASLAYPMFMEKRRSPPDDDINADFEAAFEGARHFYLIACAHNQEEAKRKQAAGKEQRSKAPKEYEVGADADERREAQRILDNL